MTKAPVSLPRAGAFSLPKRATGIDASARPPASVGVATRRMADLLARAGLPMLLAGLGSLAGMILPSAAGAAETAAANGPSLVLRGDRPPALAADNAPPPTRAALDATRQRLAERAYAGIEIDRVVVEGFAERRSPEEKLRERLNTPDRPFRSLADRNGGLRADRDSFGLRNDCIAAQGPFACRESAAIGRKSKEHWMDGR